MGTEHVVIVEDVFKVYESPAGNVIALRGVSLKISKNDVVAIMGPSGSGKTTLMNIISGIDRPTSGEVIVDGRSLTKMSQNEIMEFRRRTIGYIFQSFNLIPTLTALDNVMLPRLFLGDNLKNAEKIAIELLERVGLKGKEYRYPEELSGGEQQRVAVAVALANDPKIIIADEPTGELDIENAEKVIKLLLEQRELGKTIIITTHDPRVARMCDKIIILEDGVIKGEYTPTSVRYGVENVVDESSHETIIRSFLELRIKEISMEIEKLVESLRKKEISIEKFIEEYNKLENLRKAYSEEVRKLGIVKK